MRKIILSALLILVSEFIFSQAWMQYLPATKSEKELTFFDYQDAFEQWCQLKGIDGDGYYNYNGEKVKAKGWKQFKRWEILMEGQYDPATGRMLTLEIGREIARYYKEKSDNTDNIGGNWTSIAYGQEGWGNDGNGRINCVAFHPDDSNAMWVGTPWGGIWSTTDHGETWTPLSDFLMNIAIGAIAIPSDYSTSQTIYLGTGDRGYNSDMGIGLLKSTDGGYSWQSTQLTMSFPDDFYVNRILIHPENNNILYAGTKAGVYKSSDAGETWSNLVTCFAVDMEFHATNPQIIYVSTRSKKLDPYTRVMRTTNAGSDWYTVLEVEGVRTDIAVSQDEPDWVYAVAVNSNDGLQGIYRSINSGATFDLIYDGSVTGHNLLVGCNPYLSGGQANYDLAIAVNPLDAENVFIGGVEMWKTTDGGVSWTLNTDGYGSCNSINHNVHVDHHWLAYQPGTNNLFTCNDGGIHYSTNNGASYTNISGGLVINQPYRVGCTPQAYSEVLMGQQDNGIVLWSDNSINFVGGGDGGTSVINPMDINNQYFSNNSFRKIYYTKNHWSSSNTINMANDSSGNWFKPIVCLPPDTVLFGFTDLYRSNSKGSSHFKIMDFPDTVPIRIIAVAPSDNHTMFVANKLNVYKTTDGGAGWQVATSSWPIDPARCYQITFKDNDPNVIWITDTQWDNGVGVLRSTNGGVNWDTISDGLPDCPYYDILQNKLQTGYEELYVCGYFGVFVKLGENPWIPFNNGLPHVLSFDMDIHYDGAQSKIRTGTHGRGVWESDLFSTDNSQPWTWTGRDNSSWHDPQNWSFMEVPTGQSDVIIPANCPYNPAIYLTNTTCKSLVINQGAQLTIVGKTLAVLDSLVVSGTFSMSAPGSELEMDVNSVIKWQSGSSFNATTALNNKIRIYGNWIFSQGANNVKIDSADVYFMGNTNNIVYSLGTNCGFNNLFIMKNPAKSLIFDSQSTGNLILAGDLNISSGAKMTHNSTKIFQVNGDITANGDLFFQSGTCLLKGENANIHLASSISFFKHLEVFASVSQSKILTSDILIGGNLILTYGQFDPAGYNIKLTGDLTRTSGIMATGSGRMIFRGSDRQTISGSNINLNILELAKPADTLWIKGTSSVNCQSYDWTEGTIAVMESGTLVASDLIDDGIYGSFYLNSANNINLTQDAGQYIDLNGIIRIENGTFRVNGGKGESYWPDNVDSEIHMSGGLLDFVHQGIYLTNGAGLVEDITGGVIRTTKGFKGLRSDFTPSGGYIELWSTGNADLSHGPGSAFYDVRINKESGTVSAISDLTFNYALTINAGTFNVNGRTVSVYGSFNNYGTLKMTLPASQLNAFGNVFWRAGSSSDITDGLISFNRNWSFESGTNALLTGNNTVKAIGSLAQIIYHKDPDACFAHFMSDKTGQHLTLDVSSAYPMRVTGNLTINGSNQFSINSADLIVGGAFQTESMSITTLNGGTADLQNFILNGTLDIDAGSMMVHNSFSQAGGGQLIIDGGSFILDKPYSGELFSFAGTTDLNSGFFEISFNGIQFGTGAIVNFNGGNLRIGGDFKATALNSFKPSSGTVELINTHGANIEVYNGNYFHNLLINKTAENPCYLSYPLIVNGQLAIESGELDTYSQGMLIEGDLIIQNSGTLTAGASEIYIRGDWVNNRGSDGFTEGTSNVWLYQSQQAVIYSETFYNLTLQSSLVPGQYVGMAENSAINVLNDFVLSEGAFLMNNNANLTVEGNLHIKNGSGLNANPAATGTMINCFGHWWDYNTIRTSMQGFTCGQSTVNFKGAGDQQLIAYNGASFYHLNLQKPANTLQVFNSVTMMGDLTLQSGSWNYGATGLSYVFFGDFNCLPGALWLDAQNEVSFDGVQAQTISNTSVNPLNFGVFRVDRQDFGGDSGQLSLDSDISCSQANFVGGDIYMADHQFDCTGDMNILPDASVEFLNNATIRMANNKVINVNGGSLFIGGDAVNQPLVTHLNTGYYKIQVHSFGQINAAHTTFEYLAMRGIEFAVDGGVFGDQPFNYCTLRDGISGGMFFYMSSASDITLHNVNFPSNTWGGLYNVAKYENVGNVYLPGAIGGFAGPTFDYNPHNRIHWPSMGIWEGDESTEWHDLHNWRYDFQVPDAATDVIIPAGATYYPNFHQIETTVNSLRLDAGASLTISKDSLTVLSTTDIAGALNLSADYTALFTDSLVWQAGSSATLASRANIMVSGNMFIRQGSNLHLNLGSIRFYGNGESKLICHDTAQINGLYNDKIAPFSLSLEGDTLAQLTVNGLFSNGTNATLKCPSSQEWIFKGNFRNIYGGHFRCDNGTLRLKGSITTQSFRVSPGDYFYNLIVETPLNLYYTTSYSDTLRVKGNLVINPNSGNTSKITANGFKIMMWGDWTNNVGATGFNAGASEVWFWHSSNPQSISGNTVFNELYAHNNLNGLSITGNNTVDDLLVVLYPLHVNGNLTANVVNIDDSPSELHLYDGCYMQAGTLIQGGVVHAHGGTFMVNDLNEDGIFGTYIVDNGLVVLGQEEYSTSHDFMGSITINGGELRCAGGSGSSAWPANIGGSYANLTMTGGLFNLTNHGIDIYNNNFTENISGGKICVYSAFHCNAGVDTFTPAGGAVEIVSDNDAGVSIASPNSYFWNLIINHADNGGTTYPGCNFRVKNELKVMSGKFHIDGFEIIVGP